MAHNGVMNQDRSGGGFWLRQIASRGWADEDADVVAELLGLARDLASVVTVDTAASSAARELAQELLDRLSADTVEGAS